MSADHKHHDQVDGHHEAHAGHEHHDYAGAVNAFRADKDHFFGHDRRSPIPADQRQSFQGLSYFDVDEALVFEDLLLEPYTGTEPNAFAIPTSDGGLRPAVRAGTLRFVVDGIPCALTGYTFEDATDGPLFVPFLDGTTGHESYSAGRYLDLVPEDDGTYVLDFNLAYHPSCVYDSRYSCPLTPSENRLPVRIEAGERLPG